MVIGNNSSFAVMKKDPTLAMALSVVPGIGQFYNGESRKGLLFLLVTIFNSVTLLFWLLRETIFKFFAAVAYLMHVSLNLELAHSLLSIEANSPICYALFLLLIVFTAYAMQDAFAKAQFKRLQAIYSSSSLAISEATAGSYLMHFLFLFFVLFFVFFFCKQPLVRRQPIEIEFVSQDSPVPKKLTERKLVSAKAAEATGKHNPLEKVTTAAKGSRVVKPQIQTPKLPMPQPMPQPQPQAKPQPTTLSQSLPVVAPLPVLRPTISTPVAAVNPLPQPAVKTSFSPSKVVTNPLPTLMQSTNSLPAPLPPDAARQRLPFAGQPAVPGPIRDISPASVSGSSAPSPLPLAHHSSSSSSNVPGSAYAPQPKAVEGSHSGKSDLPTLAAAPSARPGDNGAAKEGRGNPQLGARPDLVKDPGARKEPNFSGFMADLQRRIKQAWYPPKAPASANCIIVFKVHLNGEMSGLRLQRSSGIATYDNAALKAVENAAPFRHLPEGATEAVDVQFTFDYNVFQGSGGGAFRR